MIPSYNPIASPSKNTGPSSLHIAVVNDDRAIRELIEEMILRSGLSQSEIARRMGVRLQSLTQYRKHTRPGVRWLTRLADVTGHKIYVEFTR